MVPLNIAKHQETSLVVEVLDSRIGLTSSIESSLLSPMGNTVDGSLKSNNSLGKLTEGDAELSPMSQGIPTSQSNVASSSNSGTGSSQNIRKRTGPPFA